MTRFDRVIIADWSAASALSPIRPSADAIWLGRASAAGQVSRYFRGRAQAEAVLLAEQHAAQQAGERLLIGCDFPMGYPSGFAAALTGQAKAPAVWAWLADRIRDDADNRNNRFDVAAAMNRHFDGVGPFWGRPASLLLQDLPARKTADYAALGLAERRAVETLVPRAQPVWKLYTTGAAGSQGLIGQPMIHRFSQLAGVAVWPFAAADAPVVLAEVYPSLLARAVAADPAAIKDEAQVRLLSRALFTLAQTAGFDQILTTPEIAREEGWILGAGHTTSLLAALP